MASVVKECGIDDGAAVVKDSIQVVVECADVGYLVVVDEITAVDEIAARIITDPGASLVAEPALVGQCAVNAEYPAIEVVEDRGSSVVEGCENIAGYLVGCGG